MIETENEMNEEINDIKLINTLLSDYKPYDDRGYLRGKLSIAIQKARQQGKNEIKISRQSIFDEGFAQGEIKGAKAERKRIINEIICIKNKVGKSNDMWESGRNSALEVIIWELRKGERK